MTDEIIKEPKAEVLENNECSGIETSCDERDSLDVINKEDSLESQCESEEIEAVTNKDGIEDKNSIDENIPIFMRDDWQRRVEDFEKEYPIAKEFGREIGKVILESDTLKSDEGCLYKALLKVMSNNYLADADKAKDSDFLENYIYTDKNIVAKIVGDYLDSFDDRKLPRAMTKGGQISLTQPSRPKTVLEAGRIAERIMRR